AAGRARPPSRDAMESADAMTDIVLRVQGIELNRGPRRVLAGATFDVARGALVALMGPSGSGKTTILRAIAGLETFDAGTIGVDDLTLASGEAGARTLKRLRKKVGFVFQFHCLFEHLTVLRNVCLAPVHALRLPQPDAETRARELLRALG